MNKYHIGDILSFTYKNTKFEVRVEDIKKWTLIIRNIKTQTLSSLTCNPYQYQFILSSPIPNRLMLPNKEPVDDLIISKPATFPFNELPLYLKLQILLRTDNETFNNLGTTNKELYSIYSGKLTDEFRIGFGNLDESFYQERSEHCFKKIIYSLRFEENLSWREFYYRAIQMDKSFYYLNDIFKYIRESKLLELKIINTKRSILKMDNSTHNIIFEICTTNGHINILDWFAQNDILPKPYDIDYAIENDQIAVCEWFASKNLIPLFWNSIYSFQSIEMLQWMMKHDYTLSSNDSYQAVINGKFHIVKFLIEKKIYPPFAAIGTAISCGYLDILEYFYDNEWMFNPPFSANRTKLEDVLENNGIIAGEYGQLHILKYLETKGFEINNIYLSVIIDQWKWKEDHINILEYSYNKNIILCDDDIISLIHRGLLESLKWLHERSIKMKKEYLDVAIKGQYHEIVEWFKSIQIN